MSFLVFDGFFEIVFFWGKTLLEPMSFCQINL